MSDEEQTQRRLKLQQQQDIVQSDLATNLFAVFLAILASLQLVTIVTTTAGFKLRLTPEHQDPPHPLGLIRSWHPVMPINRRVLIRNDRAIGLNLTPIANGIAAGVSPFEYRDDISDHSRTFRSDPAPSSFFFMLYMDPSTAFPDELVAWSLEFGSGTSADLPDDVQDWVDAAQAIDIYVSIGQEVNAWSLAALLSEQNVPLRLQLLQTEETFSFSRQTRHYGFEGVYK